MKAKEEQALLSYFQGKPAFSREDLYHYFVEREGDLNRGTLGWRIYDLKKAGLIHEIKRGWYATQSNKEMFAPEANPTVQRIAALINQNYQRLDYCVWDMNWLNHFTELQYYKETYIVEVEKDMQSTVAVTLSDNGFAHVSWLPWSEQYSLIHATDTITILPLITRSPLREQTSKEGKKIIIPSLEKILVDIFRETKVFYFLQGTELENIYRNAINRYAINFTTLFAYAKRRGKAKAMYELIEKLDLMPPAFKKRNNDQSTLL